MCTVTIHAQPQSLLVTMNRDEMRSRGPESPPEVFDGLWMAPLDSDAGGTWIGANRYGVTACLLNGYMPEDAHDPHLAPGRKSRGLIVPSALRQGSFESILKWIENDFDPEDYASFVLLLLSTDKMKKFRWHKAHGLEQWDLHGEWNMVTSALFYMEEVRQFREEKFQEWVANGRAMRGALPAFNILMAPGHEDWSPLVSREWSATRSITQVEVGIEAANVVMRYWPEPETDPDNMHAPLTLPLAEAVRSQ